MIGFLSASLVVAALATDPSESAASRPESADSDSMPLGVPRRPPEAWNGREWRRGRRVSTSGIFLGWAGIGLAAGGTTLAVSGRDTGPVTNRELLMTTVAVGGGLASIGMGLQVIGAMHQRRAMAPGLRPRPTRNLIAASLASASVVGSGLLAWRLLDDSPDGLWVIITAPIAIGGALGATGLHTITLIEGDGLARESGIRATIGPGYVRIDGRF